MKGFLLVLLIGIVCISTNCFAAENRAALDPGADPALVNEIVGAVQAAGPQTDAIIKKLQELKSGKTPADQAQIQKAIDSQHRNWVGVDYDAAIVTGVTQAAAAVTPTANAIPTPVSQAIKDKFGAGIVMPQVKVIPQAQMQGVIGPMLLVAENVIVIGDRDMKTMGALSSFWAHECAETALLASGKTKDQAHQAAETLEAEIRAVGVQSGVAGEIAAAVITSDAERAWDMLKIVPEGGTIKIKCQKGLENNPALQEHVKLLGRRAAVQLMPTLPTDGSLGVFQVEVSDKSGKVIGTGRMNVTGELHRLNGILNEGVLAACIPDIQSGENPAEYKAKHQQTLNLLLEQHRANTDADAAKALAITADADPSQWPSAIRIIKIDLPAPVAANIDLNMEQEISRQIFGKAA